MRYQEDVCSFVLIGCDELLNIGGIGMCPMVMHSKQHLVIEKVHDINLHIIILPQVGLEHKTILIGMDFIKITTLRSDSVVKH